MTKILIAEDDNPIREGLEDLLEGEGYDIISAKNGEIALELYKSEKVDLALLDIMMPKLSGYDVCREIRKTDDKLPIIFLTAKEEEIDKVVGLELGADDYIVKPFGVRELLARINSVLRRSRNQSSSEHDNDNNRGDNPIVFGECSIDTVRFTLSRTAQVFNLSEREVNLLIYFYKHPDEVLSRELLLEKFWGIEYSGTTRTLDQHIAKLRQKIEENPAHPRHIHTVHGTGYRFLK
jgi:two-component system, OmpR family, alkaline phosphatase synthesis response regulator PhoP